MLQNLAIIFITIQDQLCSMSLITEAFPLLWGLLPFVHSQHRWQSPVHHHDALIPAVAAALGARVAQPPARVSLQGPEELLEACGHRSCWAGVAGASWHGRTTGQ